MSSELKLLLHAESIIQRDAILSALKDQGIEAFSAPRDISRKIADNTVDLAYEGYSAIFEGFAIQVQESDYDRAKQIADQVLHQAEKVEAAAPQAPGGSLRRFYFCCLFSMSMPILFHGLALYHLYHGLKNGERIHPVFAAMSFLIFAITGGGALYLLMSKDLIEALRSLAEML